MLFLLTGSPETKIGKDSRKRFSKIILFYISPSSPQLQRPLFLLKIQKTNKKKKHIKNTRKNILKYTGQLELETKILYKKNIYIYIHIILCIYKNVAIDNSRK